MYNNNKIAHDVNLIQIKEAATSVNYKGTNRIKFRAILNVNNRTVERTVIAQGKAAALIEKNLDVGATHCLKVFFERMPGAEEGKLGGEYLTVIGIGKNDNQKDTNKKSNVQPNVQDSFKNNNQKLKTSYSLNHYPEYIQDRHEIKEPHNYEFEDEIPF